MEEEENPRPEARCRGTARVMRSERGVIGKGEEVSLSRGMTEGVSLVDFRGPFGSPE